MDSSIQSYVIFMNSSHNAYSEFYLNLLGNKPTHPKVRKGNQTIFWVLFCLRTLQKFYFELVISSIDKSSSQGIKFGVRGKVLRC